MIFVLSPNAYDASGNTTQDGSGYTYTFDAYYRLQDFASLLSPNLARLGLGDALSEEQYSDTKRKLGSIHERIRRDIRGHEANINQRLKNS